MRGAYPRHNSAMRGTSPCTAAAAMAAVALACGCGGSHSRAAEGLAVDRFDGAAAMQWVRRQVAYGPPPARPPPPRPLALRPRAAPPGRRLQPVPHRPPDLVA